MIEAEAAVPAMPVAARRAVVFGILLLAVGAVAVCLRVFQADLHPQLALFLYSIPSNSAVSVFSHEVVARAPRYFLLAWLGSSFRVPEWVLLFLFLALLAFALSHLGRARALLGWRKP